MESYKYARHAFEERMSVGVRPEIYLLKRLAGGDYLSHYTQTAWEHYRAGWIAANGRDD